MLAYYIYDNKSYILKYVRITNATANSLFECFKYVYSEKHHIPLENVIGISSVN